MIKEKDWSYDEIFELGIEVCASCGGANLNSNWKKLLNHFR